MNKTALILVAALVLTGCKPDKINERIGFERYCFNETIEARSKFILQCIKDANPMSDEDPEDWIEECESTARKLYCPEIEVIQIWRGQSYLHSKPKPLEVGERDVYIHMVP